MPSAFAHHAAVTAAIALRVMFVRAGPHDIPSIEEMLARCSQGSRSKRFFAPVPVAPHGYLRRAAADTDQHFAYLVKAQEQVVGLAEIHRVSESDGDVGLIIEDRYQRLGIGRAAFDFLSSAASTLGIDTLRADIRSDNMHLVRALRRDRTASVARDCDVCHIEVEVPADGLCPALSA